jgi:hypothetical protein
MEYLFCSEGCVWWIVTFIKQSQSEASDSYTNSQLFLGNPVLAGYWTKKLPIYYDIWLSQRNYRKVWAIYYFVVHI